MSTLTVRPQDGGKLVTRAASADVGAANYTRKLNWRRDIDADMVREGFDFFLPFGQDTVNHPDYPTHPYPGADKPLNLIVMLRRPSGEAALIVGTTTTLYRFIYDNSGYHADPTGDYATGLYDGPGGAYQPYFEEFTSRWKIIGDGFSENGKRWETSIIDGTLVLNNSVDLPVAYRVEWDYTRPLTELRDQGVVCVGTISDTDGILVAGDITELSGDGIELVLGVQNSSPVKVWQTGFKAGVGSSIDGVTLNATTGMFSSSDVGRIIVWSDGKRQRVAAFSTSTQITLGPDEPSNPPVNTPHPAAISFKLTDLPSDGWPGGTGQWTALALNADGNVFTPEMVGTTVSWADGTARKIIQVMSPTMARTDTDAPVASNTISFQNPLAYASKEALESAGITGMTRRHYRVIWSELNNPERWAAAYNTTFVAGSSAFAVTQTTSLKVGDNVAVSNAGIDGGVLTDATIIAIGAGTVTLDKTAVVSGEGAIQRSDSIGSIVGYEDLQDDGSGIIKMAPLAGRLVIYKDTNIFIARFTGQVERPFTFERIVVEHGRSLYFRNTLSNMQDRLHFFAGRDRFYQFDLTTRQPQPIPEADLISNLFYRYARIEKTEVIFAADNHITQEIWIVVPEVETICWDYLYATTSTTDIAATAAATVKSSVFPFTPESGEWFLFSLGNPPTLQTYGLSTEPTPGWDVAVNPQGNEPSWRDGERIYYRRTGPYSNTTTGYVALLSSGMIHFGKPYEEKHLERYVLGLSSRPQVEDPNGQPRLTIRFWTAPNQNATERLLGTTEIVDAEWHGMIPIHSVAHYFRDEIQVAVLDNPIRIHNRTFDYQVIGSKSHRRNQT